MLTFATLRYALVFLLVAATGCSRSGTVRVQGTVNLDGKPLAGATVLFISQEAEGRDANGSTNADGVFHLSTFQPNDGALPGKYKVVVQPPSGRNVGAAVNSPEEAQRAATEGRIMPEGAPLVFPARYTRPDETTLEQVVPATGAIVFNLQSK